MKIGKWNARTLVFLSMFAVTGGQTLILEEVAHGEEAIVDWHYIEKVDAITNDSMRVVNATVPDMEGSGLTAELEFSCAIKSDGTKLGPEFSITTYQRSGSGVAINTEIPVEFRFNGKPGQISLANAQLQADLLANAFGMAPGSVQRFRNEVRIELAGIANSTGSGADNGSPSAEIRVIDPRFVVRVTTQSGQFTRALSLSNPVLAKVLTACGVKYGAQPPVPAAIANTIERAPPPPATNISSQAMVRWQQQIVARIQRAWIRPPSAHAGLDCTIYVTQEPDGTVTAVRLGGCNGDAAARESIENAANRASPLPAPPDPAMFHRNLEIEFKPSE